MLEAERRPTIFSHTQLDERVNGKRIGFGRWLFLRDVIKTKRATHFGFGDIGIGQARYLQRLQ